MKCDPMRRYQSLVMAMSFALGAFAGCGDNSKSCGTGTEDKDGVCTPLATCGTGTKVGSDGTCVPDGSVVCTGGTIFNATSGHCDVDPASCQGDTVLIDGTCQDPTAGLTVDSTEAAEPNGLGVLGEPSQNPAGIITLKAVGGDAFVIHGKIIPADHNDDGILDNDVDTYGMQVSGPTLIEVSVDGVHGLSAGFLSLAAAKSASDPLANYTRAGVNLTGDTSKRQLYLPTAGIYVIAVADTRTVLSSGTVAGATTGHPDFEYYVSIKNLALPTPTPLTLTNGHASAPAGDTLNGDVKFFSATGLGAGYNVASERVDSPNMNPSVVVNNGPKLLQIARGSTAPDPFFGGVTIGTADAAFSGVATTDTVTLAADSEYFYNTETPTYTFTLDTSSAVPLSTSGGTATAPNLTDSPTLFSQLNLFYFDVANDNDTINLALSWNHPVDAVLLDSHRAALDYLSWDPQNGPVGDTISAYNGQLRFPKAGRYYIAVYDPNNAAGSNTATSTIATATNAAVTLGTPLAAQTVDDKYDSLSFTYASMATTEPWQLLKTTTTGSATLAVDFYDPSTTFGRLDPVDVSGTPLAPTLSPVFSGAAVGRIVLADPTSYLVHVRPDTTTGARAITLNFAARVFHDYMTLTAGTAVPTLATETTTATPPKFYFLKTAAGNRLTITITPNGATAATEKLSVQTLATDETTVSQSTSAVLGATHSLDVTATQAGWVAFSVNDALNSALSNYSVAITVKAPVAYTNAAGTTVFADVCPTGTVVNTFGNDEGTSDPVTGPTGFKLFGAATTDFVISTNGFLAFDNAGFDAEYQNLSLPDATDTSNGVVAPYWDDLNNVVVCTKTTGTKMTIQWTGTICNLSSYAQRCLDGVTKVQTQAILDGSNSTIEFVYGPLQGGTGGGATVGIEDLQSVVADQLSFDTAGSVAASSSKKLTPGP